MVSISSTTWNSNSTWVLAFLSSNKSHYEFLVILSCKRHWWILVRLSLPRDPEAVIKKFEKNQTLTYGVPLSPSRLLLNKKRNMQNDKKYFLFIHSDEILKQNFACSTMIMLLLTVKPQNFQCARWCNMKII